MEDDWKTAVRSIGELFHSETVQVILTDDPVPFADDFEKVTVAVGVFALICCFVGVSANSMIIFMGKKILSRADKQETQHLCILSTALADLVFTATHCPLTFAMYALQTFFHRSTCLFLLYTTHLATVASSLSLLCLNIDKFVSLRFPLRYHDLISYKRGKISVVIVWIIAISWATFFVFGPLTRFEDGCKMSTYEPYGFIVYMIFFTLFSLVPLTISFCISLYIFFVAKLAQATQNAAGDDLERPPTICGAWCRTNVNRILKSESSNSNMTKSSSANSNIGSTLIETDGQKSYVRSRNWTVYNLRTVLFVFSATNWSFCTLVPYRVFYAAFQFYKVGWAEWLILAAYALIISYPAGNPFVTVITQPQYRKLLLKMVRRRRMKSSESTRSATVRRIEN